MPKKPERNESEHLKGIIRKLKSENKNLKKRLGTAEKQSRRSQQIADDVQDLLAEEMCQDMKEEMPLLEQEKCPTCASPLEVTDIGPRRLYICSCGYRRSKKS